MICFSLFLLLISLSFYPRVSRVTVSRKRQVNGDAKGLVAAAPELSASSCSGSIKDGTSRLKTAAACTTQAQHPDTVTSISISQWSVWHYYRRILCPTERNNPTQVRCLLSVLYRFPRISPFLSVLFAFCFSFFLESAAVSVKRVRFRLFFLLYDVNIIKRDRLVISLLQSPG